MKISPKISHKVPPFLMHTCTQEWKAHSVEGKQLWTIYILMFWETIKEVLIDCASHIREGPLYVR